MYNRAVFPIYNKVYAHNSIIKASYKLLKTYLLHLFFIFSVFLFFFSNFFFNFAIGNNKIEIFKPNKRYRL